MQQSQRLFCLSGRLSDLCQHDLVGVCAALDAEDEGVFVGVMLDDVIVHVHEDTDRKRKNTKVLYRNSPKAAMFFVFFYRKVFPHSPFFTFLVHFGYPLCGHAILL